MNNPLGHPESWFWRWGAIIALGVVVGIVVLLLSIYFTNNDGSERHIEFDWKGECVAVVEVAENGSYSVDRLEEC